MNTIKEGYACIYNGRTYLVLKVIKDIVIITRRSKKHSKTVNISELRTSNYLEKYIPLEPKLIKNPTKKIHHKIKNTKDVSINVNTPIPFATLGEYCELMGIEGTND